MDAFHVGTMYGDPVHEASYEQMQTQTLDCVEMSADDVIAQVTGLNVSEADITAQAQHMQSGFDTDPVTGQPSALYDPASGTDFRDTPALLAAYGVHGAYTDDATAQYGGSATGLAAIETQLAAGHHVIASVDADTIWNALGIESTADMGQSNHALVVTGVDTTTGTVYLNDTGVPNGADEAVPISVFEQAWATSGHAMVTTDGSASATVNPLQVPGIGAPASYFPTDPFGSYHVSPDPFGPSDAEYFGIDDSTLLAVGAAGLAAAAGATMLHPRARAAVAATTKSTIGRTRSWAAQHTSPEPVE